MSYRDAVLHSDMDAVARREGFASAAQQLELLELQHRLATGGRLTPRDIERAHASDPHIPLERFNRLADAIMAGRTARERADNLVKVWARSVGIAEERLPVICEQAHQRAQSLAVQDYAMPLERQGAERDAHRDKHLGIDQRARVEAAKKAAANPDAIRRADLERGWEQHDPQLKFYERPAHERRELVAQVKDRIVDRMQAYSARDRDPNRLPDRSDDRRDDIGLSYDRVMSDQLAVDELSIAANPELERTDYALTHAESMERG